MSGTLSMQLGVRVLEVLGLGVEGVGFRVRGLGFRVWGSGFRVWGFGLGLVEGFNHGPRP